MNARGVLSLPFMLAIAGFSLLTITALTLAYAQQQARRAAEWEARYEAKARDFDDFLRETRRLGERAQAARASELERLKGAMKDGERTHRAQLAEVDRLRASNALLDRSLRQYAAIAADAGADRGGVPTVPADPAVLGPCAADRMAIEECHVALGQIAGQCAEVTADFIALRDAWKAICAVRTCQ